jgi:hypothetical protein
LPCPWDYPTQWAAIRAVSGRLGMSAKTLRKWIRQADVDGDEVTGVVDWSEASQGDALFDVAILTLGHKEHLGDVVAATAPTSTATSSAHGGRCDA